MSQHSYNSKRTIKSKVVTDTIHKSAATKNMMKPHASKVHIRSQIVMHGGPST
mgnify:FL=1